MEKKLEVKNLIVSFRTQGGKVQAVRDISFDLYKGETLAIVGESGSGKSVTSKAIIQILAGNAIVEGGEIIYDGHDLLKISEEEMVKLRGDKISMIFQDPLSSLNPIMRVGTQLTEAMLLKAKATRNNARKLFNSLLKQLNIHMDMVSGAEQDKARNSEYCKLFDEFCVKSASLESAYNRIYGTAVGLKLDIDNTLFLISKKQPIDERAVLRNVIKSLPQTYHPDIVVADEQITADLELLTASLKSLGWFGKVDKLPEGCTEALERISQVLEVATNRPKPNYFTLGYYMLKNPTANVDDMPLDELAEMTRKFLDEDFMLDFIEVGSKALVFSHSESLERKKQLLGELEQALEYFRQETLDQKETKAYCVKLIDHVEKAIDKLEIVKNSAEYTFRSSLLTAVKKYFSGLKSNPKEQARFDKQTAKREALIAKGKAPDWKVVPAALVDLDLAKRNIRTIIHNLRHSYAAEIEADAKYVGKDKMVQLIEYFKEQASAVVYKITPKMAKAKALKLMEEVGIPEPAIRFRQYPFEFSGGMRQRIVIAIALAANPDILICDEPTTALDVTIQSQILELINRIKAERNLSVIFITHDLGVVANMADKIAVMYAGKIVEYGTADDIFYDPRHPYTWALLSSMPDLNTTEKLDAIPGTPPNMIFPPKGDAFAARNKYALEIDFEQEPPMFQVSDTHFAATWLLHPDAPKAELPKILTERIARMSQKEEE